MPVIDPQPDTPVVITGGWRTPEIPVDTPIDPMDGVWIVRYMRLDGYAYATRPHRPGQPGVIVHPSAVRPATSAEYAAALCLDGPLRDRDRTRCCGPARTPCCANPTPLDCKEAVGAVKTWVSRCDECGTKLTLSQVHDAHGLHTEERTRPTVLVEVDDGACTVTTSPDLDADVVYVDYDNVAESAAVAQEKRDEVEASTLDPDEKARVLRDIAEAAARYPSDDDAQDATDDGSDVSGEHAPHTPNPAATVTEHIVTTEPVPSTNLVRVWCSCGTCWHTTRGDAEAWAAITAFTGTLDPTPTPTTRWTWDETRGDL